MNPLAIIRGAKMAEFKTLKWKDNFIKLCPNNKDIRDIIGLLPYFWSNEIIFDLMLWSKKDIKKNAIWEYKWELVDIENKLIKGDKYNIEITEKEYAKSKRIRKEGAVVLGYLHPNKHYRVFITLTNEIGDKSERYLACTFSLKDKDEFRMQILILLIGIFFAFILLAIEMSVNNG